MDECNNTYIDLFTGCGGLSLGLHLSGWKGLFAIEKNAMAFGTLKKNLIERRPHFAWPMWLEQTNHDIDEILREYSGNLKKLKGQVKLIAGGPPCCGFSTAGLRRESDERNGLVHSYLSFVETVRPTAILFENVRGFTYPFRAKAENGRTYSHYIVAQLKELGYEDAHGELLDMSHFGVPQHRTRFILVATLIGKAPSFFELIKSRRMAFLKSKDLAPKYSAHAAISDLEKARGLTPSPDTDGFDSGIYAPCQNNFQRLMRNGISPTKIPDSHRFPRHTKAVEKVFQRLLETAPRNHSISGESRTKFGLKKRSVAVMDPELPSPTITTIPDDYVHYAEPRVMTVRECARLQSFPDWFEFTGPYTTGGKERTSKVPRYSQVGNAIPPLFAEQAGLILKEILTDAKT